MSSATAQQHHQLHKAIADHHPAWSVAAADDVDSTHCLSFASPSWTPGSCCKAPLLAAGYAVAFVGL